MVFQGKTLIIFRNSILVLSFFVVGFGLYSHVLRGEFVSDDFITIVHNPAIKDVTAIKDIWCAFNTRFLVGWSFAWNYHFHQLDVWGYHLINVWIHIFNTLLVFVFACWTLGLVKKDRLLPDPLVPSVAYFSALIFLTHPIQTQGVSYITQRAVLLGTFFYLATLVSYICYRRSGNILFMALSFLMMLMGIICKEIVATLPVVILLYEVCFFRKKQDSIKRLIRYLLPYMAGLALLVILFKLDQPGSVLQLNSDVSHKTFSWQYFLTEINVLRTYLRLIVFPAGQNHHHDYRLVMKVFEWRTLFSVLLLGGLVWLAVACFKKHKLVTFCIGWFFITTSVELMTVSFVQRKMMEEHWLYLPMVGVSFLPAYLLARGIKTMRVYRVVMTGAIVILCFLSYQRNYVWQTEIAFWLDVYKKSPRHIASFIGLGQSYQHKDQLRQAEKVYQEALQFHPRSKVILNNLGVVLAKRGKEDHAVKVFHQIIEISPTFMNPYNNIAFIYYNQREYEKAIVYYRQYLNVKDYNPRAYEYYGKSLVAVHAYPDAMRPLKKALKLYERNKDSRKVEEIKKLLSSIPWD